MDTMCLWYVGLCITLRNEAISCGRGIARVQWSKRQGGHAPHRSHLQRAAGDYGGSDTGVMAAQERASGGGSSVTAGKTDSAAGM